MLIWSLCRNFELYSSQRIREAAVERGHEPVEIDTGRLSALTVDSRPALLLDGKAVEPPPAAVYRSGYTRLAFGWDLSLWRQFEALGVVTLNTTAAVLRCSDKFYTLQLLAAAGLPVVDAALVREPTELEAAAAAVGGCPLVLKWSRGTRGVGTALVESAAALVSQWQLSAALEQTAHLERFHPEAAGRDRRAFVIGARLVACYERRAAAGEFRSNVHRGGDAVAHRPSRAETELAEASARVLGLEVAGVDLLPTADGPRVLEVNSVPGLRYVETVTGVDVAGALIDHLERLCVNKRQSTRK
ncbi:MAG: RimK family alpha-L-glutamate ligase [Candidatus Coatesbacteria bacterium]|nr:RimK family alpha-L-glutamate ligase [Candidatus Coatesbacteria bacterium]